MTRLTSKTWLGLSILALVAFAVLSVSDISTLTTFAQEAADTAAEVTAETVTEEAPAEEAPPADATPEQLNDYAFNTIIMFICAILVLFMQAGFAMVEVGLNTAKCTVNILSKNLLDLCLGVLLFWVVGYGLMYPGSDYAGGYFGFGAPFVARDVEPNFNANTSVPWSASSDFLFQAAFAATAATIVSGAVAGRLKFGAYLVYSVIITGLIYPISGFWKWGGGFLAEAGFHDFAGSIVVHAVGGFAGLAGAILLGPRLGRYTADGRSIPIPGHNLTFAALGVFILFIGWFGFNPGSQLTYAGASNAEATSYIALTTILAASAGAVVALIVAWAAFGKPDLTMALNGMLGGLVGITANCDCVEQWAAIVIGAVAGALVVLGVIALDKLKIDDPVGAWPVHGLCGVWGGLATGIFGAEKVFMTQLYGTAVIVAWAFITMFIVFSILKMVGFLRVSAEEEKAGLDIVEHGLHAYPVESSIS